VKDFGAEAVADDAHVPRFGDHFGLFDGSILGLKSRERMLVEIVIVIGLIYG
jgi:hypothetical protein